MEHVFPLFYSHLVPETVEVHKNMSYLRTTGVARLIAAGISENFVKTVSINKQKEFYGTGLRVVFEAIGESESIQSVSLSNNTLPNPSDYENIFKGLTKNKSIKTLELSFMGEYDLFVQQLEKYLASTETLEILNLSNNYFSAEHYQLLYRALRKNKSVKSLSFFNNNTNGNNTAISAAVRDLLLENTTIEMIYLDKCNLTNSNLEVICEGLLKNRSLTTLTLKKNKLDDGSIDTLKKISEGSSLRLIELEDNKFTQEGFSLLPKNFLLNHKFPGFGYN